MKTIGLVGGMSWESTAEYYRLINEGVRDRLGTLHSAEMVIRSIDFHHLEELQRSGGWDGAAYILTEAATSVENAGADFFIICANTMHKVADEVARAVGIPLLHIADVTADAVAGAGISTVGLLGTRFTMEQTFYSDRLTARHDLDVNAPDEADRAAVHRIIYKELCTGVIRDESRRECARIIAELSNRGAGGVILGCTEIPLLVGPDDVDVPLFDTTAIHASAAVDMALA